MPKFRVLIFDVELGKRVYAFGPDRKELRFKSLNEASDIVAPMVGHGKPWPCLYGIEPAPPGEPPLVPCRGPRRFRKLERRSINT